MRMKLRQWRLRQIMTQEELAQKSGVTEATISRLESGNQDARISTVKKLAAALGIDPKELIVTDDEDAKMAA